MSKKSKPTQKPKARNNSIDQQRQATTKLQQKPTTHHTNQQKQNATRCKSTNRREIAIREEEEEETIKISSDEDETTKTAVTLKTAADESVGSDPPTFDKSSRARNCSPPQSCSSSSSSSSLSSPISSSYRSLDYEAEADEEDANECENVVTLQRKLAGGNANLLHVQNFLNYFDEQQQKPKSTAIFGANAESQQVGICNQQLELHNTTQYQRLVGGGDTEINRLTNYVAQHAVDGLMTLQQAEANGIPNTTTHTAIAISTTTAAVATSGSNGKTTNKPCKFTISTKFLRKPRHKLKSVNLTPSAEAKNVLAISVPVDKDMLMTVAEQRNQQQAHVLMQMQQKQQPRQQPPADEPNVKFNSNFSINSLLNKK